MTNDVRVRARPIHGLTALRPRFGGDREEQGPAMREVHDLLLAYHRRCKLF